MANFSEHIEDLIEKEGGYRLTDNPDDRGGMTYAGISRRANPHWHGWAFVDSGKEPPKELVHDFYNQNYWAPIKGDDIADERVAEALFSSSVLSGPRTAARLGQAAAGTAPDGILGPQTLKAINSKDPEHFLSDFALARIARFSVIVGRDRSQIKWLRGWVNRALRDRGVDI